MLTNVFRVNGPRNMAKQDLWKGSHFFQSLHKGGSPFSLRGVCGTTVQSFFLISLTYTQTR